MDPVHREWKHSKTNNTNIQICIRISRKTIEKQQNKPNINVKISIQTALPQGLDCKSHSDWLGRIAKESRPDSRERYITQCDSRGTLHNMIAEVHYTM